MKHAKILPPITKNEDGAVEPLTLADIKAHLLIDGSEQDAKLTTLNTMCRQIIENYTNSSIVEKEIIATIAFSGHDHYHNRIDDYYYYNYLVNNNHMESSYLTLPYAPIQSIDDIVDIDGVTIDESQYVITDQNLLKFTTHQYKPITITYSTGYDVVPEQLKLAILTEIAFRFENRGEVQAMSSMAKLLAQPYKQYAWL